MPVMSLSQLSRAINEIRIQDLSAEQRLELKTSVDTLSKELETPWDTTKRIVWQEVSEPRLINDLLSYYAVCSLQPSVKACIYTLV